MSTDSLRDTSPGFSISAYPIMGKYLGYCMYVLFDFTYHTNSGIYFLSYTAEEGRHILLGWRQQQVALEYTQPYSYNMIHIYDLGERWDLRGTISMWRFGGLSGTHTIIKTYSLFSDSGTLSEENRKFNIYKTKQTFWEQSDIYIYSRIRVEREPTRLLLNSMVYSLIQGHNLKNTINESRTRHKNRTENIVT